MTLDDLKALDAKYRAQKPGLFQLSRSDPPATAMQIQLVEAKLGIALPQRYREFLLAFGGGEYGLIAIFSADPKSSWFLPDRQKNAAKHLPKDLLAISDDSAGGFYALPVVSGRAQDEVRYWNFDGGQSGPIFPSVLDFVAQHAFEPA